jgi:hypothetical protein
MKLKAMDAKQSAMMAIGMPVRRVRRRPYRSRKMTPTVVAHTFVPATRIDVAVGLLSPAAAKMVAE